MCIYMYTLLKNIISYFRAKSIMGQFMAWLSSFNSNVNYARSRGGCSVHMTFLFSRYYSRHFHIIFI